MGREFASGAQVALKAFAVILVLVRVGEAVCVHAHGVAVGVNLEAVGDGGLVLEKHAMIGTARVAGRRGCVRW